MKKILLTALALAFLPIATMPSVRAAEPAAAPTMMWDLSDLYPSPEAWTAEHDKARPTPTSSTVKGTLGKSAKDMLDGA